MQSPSSDLSTDSTYVHVLVGTQTGNAERIADVVAEALRAWGCAVHVDDFYDVVPEDVARDEHIVVCTSTWGEGELPDNAAEFHDTLVAVRPSLEGVRYGVVGLGDRFYEPHFCNGARLMSGLFEALGAERVLPRLEIDAGPTTDDVEAARAWAVRYAEAICTVEVA